MEPATTKRVRRSPETTRQMILDATETIMVEEGYAAVSTRRVAQELGLNGATVHYYFATTDDLFAALHQRMTDRQSEGLANVLRADDPLRALWDFQAGWQQSALGVEFIALSNHRKSLRPLLADVTNAARAAQAGALTPMLADAGVDVALLPPVALTTILVAIARTLANEERMGITTGHAEVRALVAWALGQLGAGGTPGRA